ELAEVRDYLKNPSKFQAIGAKIPKGVLLYGPPGAGKTLLARAVAGEAGVPFFSISGSDFVEMFVGVGAARVRDLFEQAKQHAPAIVFIDEIDAVGRHRGAGLGGGHDEREQTLNQLLVEMDGFDQRSAVILMAAPERRTRIISDKEKRIIAYHEGGHALTAYLLPNADPVHKITIMSRGRALGYTMTLPMEDKFLVTRRELVDELAMLLGGRVSEELVFGDITTGAQNDLEKGTKISRQMVTE